MTFNLKDNWPVFAVLIILLSALAATALLRPHGTGGSTSGSEYRNGPANTSVSAKEAVDLAALPATANSDAVVVSQLAPQDARSQNDAIPFAADALRPAPPFRFRGSAQDRTRARDCLALAAMAEAGGGDADQRAVMQVILNRTRHPAFSNTVCGVVFEGSERRTGCQFTFTCDGSLARTYAPSRWQAARQRADAMLGGAVFSKVGNATHYHTDWVFPWWSPKLDKIAQVQTHLFFRWRGFWGTLASLNQRYNGGEPDPIGLRREATSVDREGLELVANDMEAVATVTGDRPVDGSPAPGVHFITVSPGTRARDVLARARELCPATGFCQVYGWGPGDTRPATLPLSNEARETLRFSFVPARASSAEAVFFDCTMFPGSPPGTCLPRAVPRNTTPLPARSNDIPRPKPAPTLDPPAEAPTLKADEGGKLIEQ